MKKQYFIQKTQIVRTPTEKGESIEEMLRRLTANKEPIPDNVPPIWTPENEGVLPDYDIRADRFKVAMEATDKLAASDYAKSAEKGQVTEEQTTNDE